MLRPQPGTKDGGTVKITMVRGADRGADCPGKGDDGNHQDDKGYGW